MLTCTGVGCNRVSRAPLGLRERANQDEYSDAYSGIDRTSYRTRKDYGATHRLSNVETPQCNEVSAFGTAQCTLSTPQTVEEFHWHPSGCRFW